jgi:hypothetical protein
MDFEQLHAPGEGKPKNFTQVISMVVGSLLFILSLSGIQNPRFAGLNLSLLHNLIVGVAGVILIYSGYKNYGRHAFRACLGFGIFFLLFGVGGYLIGGPAEADLTLVRDEAFYRVFPDFQAMSMADHWLNIIIGLVLLGGAVDWWRRQGHTPESADHIEDAPARKKGSHKTLAHR